VTLRDDGTLGKGTMNAKSKGLVVPERDKEIAKFRERYRNSLELALIELRGALALEG
jgi:hypothetical protein